MDRRGVIIVTHSPEETLELGYKLGKWVQVPSVFCFFGDLAAGKTTLIKGLVAGATGISRKEALQQVNSPTYVLLNIYEGRQPLYHFDLYRLTSSEEFLGMGFDEYWQGEGVCCIEWSERISDLLPQNAIQVRMKQVSATEREIHIEGMESILKMATFINSSQDSTERGKARSERSGLHEEAMARPCPTKKIDLAKPLPVESLRSL